MNAQPANGGLATAPGGLPVTESLAKRILSLPMFPQLSDGQVRTVIGALRSALGAS